MGGQGAAASRARAARVAPAWPRARRQPGRPCPLQPFPPVIPTCCLCPLVAPATACTPHARVPPWRAALLLPFLPSPAAGTPPPRPRPTPASSTHSPHLPPQPTSLAAPPSPPPRRSLQGITDERELKKLRRKQSNRESARRSRLRKQAECEQLGRQVKDLVTGERRAAACRFAACCAAGVGLGWRWVQRGSGSRTWRRASLGAAGLGAELQSVHRPRALARACSAARRAPRAAPPALRPHLAARGAAPPAPRPTPPLLPAAANPAHAQRTRGSRRRRWRCWRRSRS